MSGIGKGLTRQIFGLIIPLSKLSNIDNIYFVQLGRELSRIRIRVARMLS